MLNTSFLVIETKRGAAAPRSVWIASSEKDYIARIAADAIQHRSECDDFRTANDAAKFDGERGDHIVEFMTQEQFDEYDTDNLSAKVLNKAEILGWHENFAKNV